MKTYKIDYEIRKGLANELGETSKVQGLQSCGLLKSSEGGLVSDDSISFAIDWSNHVVPTCNFPFPQFLQLGEVNLICTETSIYEYKNPKRVENFYLGITVSVGGRSWKVADFGTYFVLTNGFVTVVHDPDTHTYTELIDDKNIPQAECLTNFNGQCIAGGIDNSWSFYEAESLYIPPTIYNIVTEELKDIIGELSTYETNLKGQDSYITPNKLPPEILPQGYRPPAESPTTYFTLTEYIKDLTADWHVDWENYCDSNALVYYNGKLYILLKTVTTTNVVLTFLIYDISNNTWILGSGHFTELRKMQSVVKQQTMLNNGYIYVTTNSDVDVTTTVYPVFSNAGFLGSNTYGYLYKDTDNRIKNKVVTHNFTWDDFTWVYATTARYVKLKLKTPVQDGVSIPYSSNTILTALTVGKFRVLYGATGTVQFSVQMWILGSDPGTNRFFPTTNPFPTISNKKLLYETTITEAVVANVYKAVEYQWNLVHEFKPLPLDIQNNNYWIIVGYKHASWSSYVVPFVFDTDSSNYGYMKFTGDGNIVSDALDVRAYTVNGLLSYIKSSEWALAEGGVLPAIEQPYREETGFTWQVAKSSDGVNFGSFVPLTNNIVNQADYIKLKVIQPAINKTLTDTVVYPIWLNSIHDSQVTYLYKVREDALYNIGLDTWTDFTLPSIKNKITRIGDSVYTLLDNKIKKLVFTVDRNSFIDETVNNLVVNSNLVPESIAIATDTNQLFFAGGITIAGVISNLFNSYNPINDSWNVLPTLPTPVYNATMTYANGVFYLLGGNTANGINTVLYRYKFSTNRWENIGILSSDLVNSTNNLNVVVNNDNTTLFIYNTTGSTTKIKKVVKLIIQA